MNIKKKKICFLTSTRADFGLLKNLIKLAKKNKYFNINIVAFGTHFSKKFGNTSSEIKSNSFKINQSIKIGPNEDSPYALSKYFSKFSSKFNKSLIKIKPDLLVILGDRFEMLAAAAIATIHNIPICHLHGGESTQGLIDDTIRHAITKLSAIHFVSHIKYKKRLIQMGENKRNIHHVGALGLNSISKTKFLEKNYLEKKLKLQFRDKTFIVTYHPVTKVNDSIKHVDELIKAIKVFKKTSFIFTSPNMDSEHNKIIFKIKKFVRENENIYFFKSLGKDRYFNMLKYVDGVIGNSSSGIIEVPSFKKGTINIGERQKGRIQSNSVINCKPTKTHIIASIKKISSKNFVRKLKKIKNPYYKPNTEIKIVQKLKNTNFKILENKPFFDYE